MKCGLPGELYLAVGGYRRSQYGLARSIRAHAAQGARCGPALLSTDGGDKRIGVEAVQGRRTLVGCPTAGSLLRRRDSGNRSPVREHLDVLCSKAGRQRTGLDLVDCPGSGIGSNNVSPGEFHRLAGPGCGETAYRRQAGELVLLRLRTLGRCRVIVRAADKAGLHRNGVLPADQGEFRLCLLPKETAASRVSVQDAEVLHDLVSAVGVGHAVGEIRLAVDGYQELVGAARVDVGAYLEDRRGHRDGCGHFGLYALLAFPAEDYGISRGAVDAAFVEADHRVLVIPVVHKLVSPAYVVGVGERLTAAGNHFIGKYRGFVGGQVLPDDPVAAGVGNGIP